MPDIEGFIDLENQQILNEQEYQRKIDFYEMYESPGSSPSEVCWTQPCSYVFGAPSVSLLVGIGPGLPLRSAFPSVSYSFCLLDGFQSKQAYAKGVEGARSWIWSRACVDGTDGGGSSIRSCFENQEVVNKWTEPLLGES